MFRTNSRNNHLMGFGTLGEFLSPFVEFHRLGGGLGSRFRVSLRGAFSLLISPTFVPLYVLS